MAVNGEMRKLGICSGEKGTIRASLTEQVRGNQITRRNTEQQLIL